MTTTDERLLILNLLRDGKITTDDAERLLRALTTSTGETRTGKKGSEFDRVFEHIGKEFRHFNTEKFGREMQSFGEKLRRQFEGFAREMRDTVERTAPSAGSGPVELSDRAIVRVSQKAGDVSLVPSGDRRLTVTAPNYNIRLVEGEQRAEVSAVGGPAEVRIPSQTRRVVVEAAGGTLTVKGLTVEGLSARVVGGGTVLEQVVADVELDVVGAGAELSDVVGNTVEVKTNGGGIRARLGDVREGSYRFVASGAGVSVELGERSEFEVEHTVFGGTFQSEWSGEPIGENRQRIGSGSAKMSLTATGGGIYLGRRQ
jgi:hypothetical protein